MTATAIGRLMDQKKISLEWTIGESLPDLREKIHEDYANVTLRQLLQHRSGMPANAKSWWLQAGDDLSQRRQLIAIASLQEKPEHPPGENFAYSNLGYVVAGLMAAKAADMTWEELMQQEVFEPLNITSAGFGIPGEAVEIVQPWGHRFNAGKAFPIRFDNAPAIGPAGTIHMNLNDWGKFVLVHAAGKDKGYLTNETLETLHEAGPGNSYALGWGVCGAHLGGWRSARTFWLEYLLVLYGLAGSPETCAYLVATNIAGEPIPAIVDSVVGQLIQIDQK